MNYLFYLLIMRNHTFIERVATIIITLNHKKYIDDIKELISLNQFGNNISDLLDNLVNILELYLNNNNNQNINHIFIKAQIKTILYEIYDMNNGELCCKKLICE